MGADLVAETFGGDDVARTGVCVVDGYGIRVAVERRHLIVTDGIGTQRRQRRYPRVGHGIRRLVILGHTGTLTLESLRWLDALDIAWTHLDTDGKLLGGSTQLDLDNARLRRAQALAPTTATGLHVTRALLDAKLAGQASVATTHLDAPDIAAFIDEQREQLATAETQSDCREIEATAALAYWSAWTGRVAYTWARNDLPRIPEHWQRFDGRRSPLSAGSAKAAADPVNATLNYLYALAEIECRNACLRLGLDPGLGILHADVPRRDSLALDLIETIRPHVDRYVIELTDNHIFRYGDFTEHDTGHCRILAPLTHHLATTLANWETHIAPWAEHVAHTLADASPHPIAKSTPLTARNRKTAALSSSTARRKTPRTSTTRSADSSTVRQCPDCGSQVHHHQRTYCVDCWPTHRRAAGIAGSDAAALALDNPAGRTQRGEAVSAGKHAAHAERARIAGFEPSDWDRTIYPAVAGVALREIQRITGLGVAQASRIKSGKQTPHPRHWAALQGISAERRA